MTTATRPPLSDTQAKVLAYMVKFLELNDQLPTIAKIAEDFGWASSNSADTHLKAMEKKGYLTRNELHNLMLADRTARTGPVIDRPNPELKTPESELRSWIQKNLAAMHTHVESLIDCVADDDAEYSLELCSNLMSQTRGLQQMLTASIARGIDVSPEVAHG